MPNWCTYSQPDPIVLGFLHFGLCFRHKHEVPRFVERDLGAAPLEIPITFCLMPGLLIEIVCMLVDLFVQRHPIIDGLARYYVLTRPKYSILYPGLSRQPVPAVTAMTVVEPIYKLVRLCTIPV